MWNILRSTATFLSLCLVGGGGSAVLAATGANIDESLVSIQYYVDPTHPNASNANSGTSPDMPLASIQVAANRAKGIRNTSGAGTKISIAPGVYRESISFLDAAPSANPVIFEAMSPGSVTIKGSDIIQDWTFDAGSSAYTTPWTRNWGFAPNTSPPNPQFDPIGLRREMVHINGQRLQQVLDVNDLAPGKYYAEDNPVNGKLYVMPEVGQNIQNLTVEVSVRERTMNVARTSNVVVRGLNFEHAANINTSSLRLIDIDNLLLDQLAVRDNNDGGLGGSGNQNMTTNRIMAERNGLTGIGMSQSVNTLWTHIESRDNNWRGEPAGVTGGVVAGIKHLLMHDAHYENIVVEDNRAHGFWIDSDSRGITIEGLVSRYNLRRGVYLEKLQGPVSMSGSLIHDNGGYGIYIAISHDMTLTDNIVYGNDDGQLGLNIRNPVTNTDFQTGEQTVLTFIDLDIQNNIFAAIELDELVSRYISSTSISGWPSDVFLNDLLTSSIINNNEYWHPVGGDVFLRETGGWLTWQEYRDLYGLDLNSIFNIGGFVIPEPATVFLLGVGGLLLCRRGCVHQAQ